MDISITISSLVDAPARCPPERASGTHRTSEDLKPATRATSAMIGPQRTSARPHSARMHAASVTPADDTEAGRAQATE
jgi:hypothetical protein